MEQQAAALLSRLRCDDTVVLASEVLELIDALKQRCCVQHLAPGTNVPGCELLYLHVVVESVLHLQQQQQHKADAMDTCIWLMESALTTVQAAIQARAGAPPATAVSQDVEAMTEWHHVVRAVSDVLEWLVPEPQVQSDADQVALLVVVRVSVALAACWLVRHEHVFATRATALLTRVIDFCSTKGANARHCTRWPLFLSAMIRLTEESDEQQALSLMEAAAVAVGPWESAQADGTFSYWFAVALAKNALYERSIQQLQLCVQSDYEPVASLALSAYVRQLSADEAAAADAAEDLQRVLELDFAQSFAIFDHALLFSAMGNSNASLEMLECYFEARQQADPERLREAARGAPRRKKRCTKAGANAQVQAHKDDVSVIPDAKLRQLLGCYAAEPSQRKVHEHLAQAATASGNWIKAKQHLDQLVNHITTLNDAAAHEICNWKRDYVFALLQTNEYTLVLECCDRFLLERQARSSPLLTAHLLLFKADALLCLENVDECHRVLQERLNPVITRLRRNQDLDDKSRKEVDSCHLQLMNNLAVALVCRNDVSGAITLLRQHIREHPESLAIKFNLTLLLWRAGQKESACLVWMEARGWSLKMDLSDLATQQDVLLKLEERREIAAGAKRQSTISEHVGYGSESEVLPEQLLYLDSLIINHWAQVQNAKSVQTAIEYVEYLEQLRRRMPNHSSRDATARAPVEMQRGALTKSTPVLPRQNAKAATTHGPQKCASDEAAGRKTLSASFSASCLPPEEYDGRRDDDSGFRITDLLLERRKQAAAAAAAVKAAPSQKNAKRSGAAEPTASVSRSPIQQHMSRNGGGGALQLRKEDQASKYVRKLECPENVELFAYSSSLCHRITGRYIPRNILNSDPNVQKQEIERIQRDPELLTAISAVKTLSKQFKDAAQDTLGHRKELGHALLRIEESYLKLFEKLMEISLRMYWNYEHEHEGGRLADKKSIAHWKDMYQWRDAEVTKLQKILDGKEIVLKTHTIEIRDLEKRIKELQKDLVGKEHVEEELRAIQVTREEWIARERQLEEELISSKKKHEEVLEEERAKHEEVCGVKMVRRTLREKDNLLIRQDATIRELSVVPPVIITQCQSTQTVVDDDGLWDTQDCIPRFVSKNVARKMAWRRFNAYVQCRNCRGRPINQGNWGGGREQYRESDREYIDVWSVVRSEKTSKKESKRAETIENEWQFPQAIMLFLSNLPKSVVAFPFYSLEEVILQIEAIYDDKFSSDQVDASDGVAREEMPKYISEYFLKSHGLYRFLISIKNCYRQSSQVKLFARFVNLVHNDPASHDTTTDAVKPGDVPASISMTKQKNGYLDRSFLRVFLCARRYLVKPPTITKPRKGSDAMQPHVVQNDPIRKWVSLDHAINIVKWYLNYLPEETVINYCREVEYNTGIYAGRTITEIAGNRLAVRAEMRKAMLANAGDDTGNGPVDDDKRPKPRIVVDVHKVLLLLMNALEYRQELMERDLIHMFDVGDVNHDRVLSFEEFKDILRTRVPHFSDRRLLRMFREALMNGSDQSFALSMEAFVSVCNDHGLVSLLPEDRFRDPFAQQPSLAAKLKEATSINKMTRALGAMKMAAKNDKALDDRRDNVPKDVQQEHTTDDAEHSEIPEEIPEDAEKNGNVVSPRAEEVEDNDGDWQW
ncbi:TPA: hypothetical protein N0F65_001240 [Lagenidium giganteum]|uniref:EF-hand domain-containing protein n=1 Tax=Lagenidium giganteum TaxID=4803 RepID=A0AAV2YUK4_9STRA|nr:TPA: hypothetical protein N0F65_001240 [Lagenidium giganteum]